MDLEGIMLSEISQTEKEKYYIISLICGILKNITNEQMKQNKNHRYVEQIDGYQRRRGLGGWAKMCE